MSDCIEEFQHNGKTIRIFHDDDPESPREGYDNGVMLADGHRRYTLGDNAKAGRGYEEAQRALHHFAGRGQMRLFPRWLRQNLGTRVVIGLGLIDHSGISMYPVSIDATDASHPHDPGGWDSGLVGFMFDTDESRNLTGFEGTDEELEKALRAEVATYDEYLTGQVYGYVIEDDNDEDSCWGFFGFEYVKQSARDAAGYTCKHCQQALHRNVGPVIDDGDAAGFTHSCCSTCLGDVLPGHGPNGTFLHYHAAALGEEFTVDHSVTIAQRHRCAGGETMAETEQEVGVYA